MTNYYWLKLHYDLLDDWKVGTLPDSLKWRFIQCLLVAGETGEDGYLPPLKQFAFRIRPIDPDALQQDMARLAGSDLVELRVDDNGLERWFVTNFQKRQERKTAAERKRAQRERERYENITAESQPSHTPVTTRDTDKIRLDKIPDKIPDEIRNKNAVTLTENGTEDSSGGGVYSFYENNIAQLTPLVSDLIGAAIEEFGEADVIEAMTIATQANKRSWSYTNGILKKWREGGKQPAPQANGRYIPAQVEETAAERVARIFGGNDE